MTVLFQHRLTLLQDAQKVQTSHPPNPGAPRRAVPQARPQGMKKAEVEVKVKRRTDSCLLNLSLSRNLPITLADFWRILLEPRALFRNDQYLNRLIRATHIQLKSLPCLDLTESFRFSLR